MFLSAHFLARHFAQIGLKVYHILTSYNYLKLVRANKNIRQKVLIILLYNQQDKN